MSGGGMFGFDSTGGGRVGSSSSPSPPSLPSPGNIGINLDKSFSSWKQASQETVRRELPTEASSEHALLRMYEHRIRE
ncbi:hypothetical protein LINGRAHAP2_LOCUS19083 [Linum grandiflorum]